MGGSRGIGRAIALGLAQAGARVAICARGQASWMRRGPSWARAPSPPLRPGGCRRHRPLHPRGRRGAGRHRHPGEQRFRLRLGG
ncbi:hypothetical protein ACFQU7_19160 [Pseudoroseomonas wenyumeiae]